MPPITHAIRCLQTILSDPEEIVAMNGQKLPMRLQVAYISFSAHTDYRQTSEFIRAIKPQHIVRLWCCSTQRMV